MKYATGRALFCKYFSVYLHIVLILYFEHEKEYVFNGTLSGIYVGRLGTDGGIWEDWQAVRDKLANKEWSRVYHNEGRLGYPASDVQEIWVFEESGRGTRRSIVTYEDGREKESLEAFSWILTVDLVIVMEGSSYWTIDDLTDERLRVYYTFYDPIEVPGQTREYYEFFRSQL